MLLKDTKENLNIWGDKPCSFMHQALSTIKILIIITVIYKT